MDVRVHLQGKILDKHIAITGSKSETNRLLLLKALYPNIVLSNASESDDSTVMQKALAGNDALIDVHHAGTAMRFLTAYFALQEGREVILTGSQRMKERPVQLLVDALRSLGADIEYKEKEGYPPLAIKGEKLHGGKTSIRANVSSQYITALLLTGGKFKKGLELTLEGQITSMPYILMTLKLLDEVGIKVKFEQNVITIAPQPEIKNRQSRIIIESDWSSASYHYSMVALSPPGTIITLSSYKQHSLQGDSALSEIYRQMGVSTTYHNNTITIRKENHQPVDVILELNNTPDIAQTIAVTCLGLGIGCHLTGLHTLKIKETDRLLVLKTELKKLGAAVAITDDSLILKAVAVIKENIRINTYDDHRMAMAFAPLAVKVSIIINNADVVSKSYPTFWDDMRTLGFTAEVQ